MPDETRRQTAEPAEQMDERDDADSLEQRARKRSMTCCISFRKATVSTGSSFTMLRCRSKDRVAVPDLS